MNGTSRTIATTLDPADELWVIVKPGTNAAPPPADDVPGTGALVVTVPNVAKPVPVPLRHTAVSGEIAGYVASVRVEQQFHNPFDTKIEASYVFPLPQNAAVNGFLMTVGDRTIRGVIREREEAERIYSAAKSQGRVASLLTQQRHNIFTQKVANIEPGKAIDIEITYFNTLAYADGWFEFVFPMVVGPRFNPPASGSDGIGAVARGSSPAASGQKTQVTYLTPSKRSGHDISIDLAIDAGVRIEDLRSASHEIRSKRDGATRRLVSLAPGDTIPNKDFVLRYRIDSDDVKPGLVVRPDADGRGGHFAMMLIPPTETEHARRAPVEFVFVIDTSGSMSGEPLALAVEAAQEAIDRMDDRDTFQILRFSNSVSRFGERPVPATAKNKRDARRYLRNLEAAGGTMMLDGILEALRGSRDPDRLRSVAFLTDGFIGNEDEILAAIHRELDGARVFGFGIGSSPNRYLLEQMSRAGRGAVAYVGLNDPADEIMGLYFDRVSHPMLTGLSADWGALGTVEAYPERLPDLLSGRPVIVTGRYEGDAARLATDPVRISGRLAGHDRVLTLADASAAASDGLGAVWARMKIASLADLARRGEKIDRLERQIRRVALDHNLMSAFTAFVAVDSMTITEGDHGVSVAVPVPVPDGVRYETSVEGG